VVYTQGSVGGGVHRVVYTQGCTREAMLGIPQGVPWEAMLGIPQGVPGRCTMGVYLRVCTREVYHGEVYPRCVPGRCTMGYTLGVREAQ